jgi:hypothetical protein
MPAERKLPAVTENENYAPPAKHLKPMALGLEYGMDMGQHWTGYACSYNPSISIGFPWAIGVGFWPSCGSRDQADYEHNYTGTSSHYKMYNSGDPASFGTYYSIGVPSRHPAPPCYGFYVTASASKGQASDDYDSGTGELCLSKT